MCAPVLDAQLKVKEEGDGTGDWGEKTVGRREKGGGGIRGWDHGGGERREKGGRGESEITEKERTEEEEEEGRDD